MPQWRPPPSLERNALAIFLALLAVALAVAYHGVLHDPFVFDDWRAIGHNPSLRSLGAALHPPENTTVSGRPLINLSFALNRALSDDSLLAYHLTNLAILGAGACLLFGLIRRTLQQMDGDWAIGSGMVAGAAALIWAVHPLQTESITYLVQRAESLMGLCYLAVLYGLARCAAPGVSPRSAIWWGLFSVIWCWVGMGAKEVMVSAPLVALTFDRIFWAGSWREALRRRWPMYALMAASWIWLGLLVASTHGRSGTVGFELNFAWPQFLRTQAYGIMRYLRLSFIPTGQVFDYGTYWVDSPLRWVPAVLAVISLGAATLVALFRGHPVGWLGLWFFAILAPTCLIPGVKQTLAEHRMYLALAPVVIVMVVAISRLAGAGAWPVLVGGAALLALVSARRNQVYASDYSIWSDVTTKLPLSASGLNNLGDALFGLHRATEAEAKVRRALEIDPEYAEAWVNLGVIEAESGRRSDAEAAYRRAISLNPLSAAAHNDYGNLLGTGGRLSDALKELELAIKLQPDNVEAHNGYANALFSLNRWPEAEEQYRVALDLEPAFAAAHAGFAQLRYAQANAVFQTGDYAGAIARYRAAIELNPNFAPAHCNLGVALYNAGSVAAARDEFATCLRLDPTNGDARKNLAAARRALQPP